jgi:hypothetical protein
MWVGSCSEITTTARFRRCYVYKTLACLPIIAADIRSLYRCMTIIAVELNNRLDLPIGAIHFVRCPGQQNGHVSLSTMNVVRTNEGLSGGGLWSEGDGCTTCYCCSISHSCHFSKMQVSSTNPHWARVVGYGPFSLCVIHKEGLCLSSGDIDDDDEVSRLLSISDISDVLRG